METMRSTPKTMGSTPQLPAPVAGMPPTGTLRRRRRPLALRATVAAATLAVLALGSGCDGLTTILAEYNSRFTAFPLTPDGAAGGYTFGQGWQVTLPADSVETPPLDQARWYITPPPTGCPGGDVTSRYKDVNGKPRLQFTPSSIGMGPGNYELRIEVTRPDGTVVVGRCALWCTQ